MRRQEMPFLAGISGILHWLESLLIIVSGPLLTLGLGIALVDLLTGGALLTTQPGMLYTWAVSQAVGVDAQLIGAAALLAVAVHERRAWVALFYAALIAPLSYVAFIASDVFATQEADGITTATALTRLGMDGTAWIVQRSALAVALVVLSGLLRYRPPEAESVAEDERARLERDLELEPLRQRARAQRAIGGVSLLRDTALALRGKPSVRMDDVEGASVALSGPSRPPTGGGSPAAQPASTNAASAIVAPEVASDERNVLSFAQRTGAKRKPSARVKARQTMQARSVRTGRPGNASYRDEAEAAYLNGANTEDKMIAAIGCSRSIASKWVRTYEAKYGKMEQVPEAAAQ